MSHAYAGPNKRVSREGHQRRHEEDQKRHQEHVEHRKRLEENGYDPDANWTGEGGSDPPFERDIGIND